MKIFLILLLTLLSACTTIKTVEIHKDMVPLPDPIQDYKSNVKLELINNEPFVIMSYIEFQEFRIFLADVTRYIKDQKAIICYHQPESCDE